MIVRFWDMDHTLLDNDCDVSWKLFLIEKGIAPREDLDRIVLFWEQYEEGRLDPVSFNEFQLREFAGRTEEEIAELSREHFETIAGPKAYARAVELVRRQRASGDHTCMITATNIAIATPVAEYFGFDTLIATMLETRGATYTGRIIGDYCVGEGKLPFMRSLCLEHGTDLSESYYYGDSIADLPVLEAVGHPVAVNPRERLRAIALERGWPVLDF
ncbi:MAG TPA: HAD family hydrolase [Spirochaetota bacterium]|nr:MAG: Phosphoserine phosphatase [Spirochaetes bacterium ADurb.BinA120]HNU90391.1 HAD family hydrolase [Spirochaetota bacterium]HPI15699.1 HAD family hydrolase [Spirochaetota bacterium]HPV96263.1 HAD family hydrolase [Spirochaetota bacterium]